MLSSRRTHKVIYLIITFFIIVACNIPGLAEEIEAAGNNQQSEPSTKDDPQIAFEYKGEGTYVEVSVLDGLASTCTLPVAVTATVFDNYAVSIKSIGPCINDFNGCKLDETDRCALYGDGIANNFTATTGGGIDMTGCNSGSFKVSNEEIEFDSVHIVGSFQCANDDSYSMNLTMDIPRIKN